MTVEDDARRYRWIKAQTNLQLQSDNSLWFRSDKTKYYPKFSLAVNSTGFHGIEDVDVLIDRAMDMYPMDQPYELDLKEGTEFEQYCGVCNYYNASADPDIKLGECTKNKMNLFPGDWCDQFLMRA
jgi:hypothetical protein